MDSTIYSYLGPFEEIPICGQTIWTIDMFETSPPPLLHMSDWVNTQDIKQDISQHITQDIAQHISRDIAQDITLDITQHIDHNSNELTHFRTQETGSGDCRQSREESTQESINSCLQSIDNRQQIRFPYKLWKIVNECETNAIKWSTNGDSILINYYWFQIQYLNTNNYFKTQNICSFVRQLNLYGFYKVSHRSKPKNKESILSNYDAIESKVNDFHEFKNQFFQRNREDLLQYVYRRYSNTCDENSGENHDNCHQLNDKKIKKRRNSNKCIEKDVKIKRRKTKSLDKENQKPKTFDEVIERTIALSNVWTLSID